LNAVIPFATSGERAGADIADVAGAAVSHQKRPGAAAHATATTSKIRRAIRPSVTTTLQPQYGRIFSHKLLEKINPFQPPAGIRPRSHCFKTDIFADTKRERTMTNTKTVLAMLAVGAAVAFAGPACAEKMKATLDSKSEVPPNTSAGKGTADIDYDAATKKLTWKLTYSGLTGPATAAHFHGPAEAGKNAGVAVAIPNATSSPAEGSATLTDAQAADLMAGKYYVNVHTAANPNGEIRGQVTK
jgi:hypothetical protein